MKANETRARALTGSNKTPIPCCSPRVASETGCARWCSVLIGGGTARRRGGSVIYWKSISACRRGTQRHYPGGITVGLVRTESARGDTLRRLPRVRVCGREGEQGGRSIPRRGVIKSRGVASMGCANPSPPLSALNPHGSHCSRRSLSLEELRFRQRRAAGEKKQSPRCAPTCPSNWLP